MVIVEANHTEEMNAQLKSHLAMPVKRGALEKDVQIYKEGSRMNQQEESEVYLGD